MATRLLERKTGMTDYAETLLATPWIPTGLLIASTQVKAEPGLVGWVCVHSTDAGGDIHVRIWDTAVGATTVAEVVVAEFYVTVARTGVHRHDVYPLPGIECVKGIYLEVVAGDCSASVGYK